MVKENEGEKGVKKKVEVSGSGQADDPDPKLLPPGGTFSYPEGGHTIFSEKGAR